jgi:hypothetical protein
VEERPPFFFTRQEDAMKQITALAGGPTSLSFFTQQLTKLHGVTAQKTTVLTITVEETSKAM